MQTRTTAQNLIYTGHHPFNAPGPQTDRHFPRPDPNRRPIYNTGPNDIIQHSFVISLRTLTQYTGTATDTNAYSMRLPTIIDRPTHIQITGNTIGHLDNTTTGLGVKTILIESPIVKQSGYHLETTANTSITMSDGVMGLIRVPNANNTSQIFTIADTHIDMKVPIKEQGFASLVEIPVRFLDNRGTPLSIGSGGDLSPDGELIFKIDCLAYNPQREHASQRPQRLP